MAKSKGENGSGSIGKVGNRWIGRIYIDTATGRRRKSFSGKTKAEARARMQQALQDSKNGYLIEAAKLTLSQYLEQWLESAKGSIASSTYDRYEQDVRCHIVPALGSVNLQKLNPANVEMLKSSLDLKPSTTNQVLVTLSVALNQAVKWDLMRKNPVQAVKKLRDTSTGMACLSEEEAGRLVEVVRGTPREALYLVALKCGLRQGELLGLMWEDIEDRKLTVKRSVDTGKGEPRFGTTKGGAERSIVLAPSLVEALKRHSSQQAEVRLRAPWWDDIGLVFPNVFGEVQKSDTVLRQFRKDLEAAGLPRIRFHDARDTAASLLLGNGVPVHVVARMLGHKDPAMTLRRYSHVLPDMQEQAAAVMERLAF
jgi:integrase